MRGVTFLDWYAVFCVVLLLLIGLLSSVDRALDHGHFDSVALLALMILNILWRAILWIRRAG